MNRVIVLILWGSLRTLGIPALQAQQTLPFLWYNTENLFDTEDDPLTDDQDFLPGSPMQWTPERYSIKLDSMVSMIGKVGAEAGEMPAFIGLCEVENRRVLQDLAARMPAAAPRYEIVHYDCNYHRGADVALLYDPARVAIMRSEPLPVSFPFDSVTTTRDILYVQLQAGTETLHLYLNHWPSRRQDNRYREQAAHILRRHLDTLLARQPQAKVLLLGDFNDEPHSPSVAQTLAAVPWDGEERAGVRQDALYNLSSPLQARGQYTYIYKDQRNMLDQVMATGSLVQGGPVLALSPEQVYIYNKADAHSVVGAHTYIRRTYLGNKYLGGYSDHLPVYGRLIFMGR
ncbi:MAG: endonuclease/exonuclease/phosphatase family protein [Bacteroidetes bacterium]|nr:endonuclease/exonuclease/phosphatase family protein [Bacteroidota bacterium]